MREEIITCDHCGKKLNEMEDYADTEFDIINEWIEADLCKNCYVEVSNMIKNFCNKHG